MLEVEVLGLGLAGPAAPAPGEVERLSARAAACAGVRDGHLAIEFVDTRRIAHLNARYRGRHTPTDVLSFPIDGREPTGAAGASSPRELGDVVICAEHARDLREAIVHGVLHLVGFDHEVDDGEMLALQRKLLGGEEG